MSTCNHNYISGGGLSGVEVIFFGFIVLICHTSTWGQIKGMDRQADKWRSVLVGGGHERRWDWGNTRKSEQNRNNNKEEKEGIANLFWMTSTLHWSFCCSEHFKKCCFHVSNLNIAICSALSNPHIGILLKHFNIDSKASHVKWELPRIERSYDTLCWDYTIARKWAMNKMYSNECLITSTTKGLISTRWCWINKQKIGSEGWVLALILLINLR